MENRVIIYNRIRELEKEIAKYNGLLFKENIDQLRDYYESKIKDLESLKMFNEMLYHNSGSI